MGSTVVERVATNPCGTSVQSGHTRQCRGAALRRCPRSRHGSHDDVFPVAQRGNLDLGGAMLSTAIAVETIAGPACGVKSWASRMKGASVRGITSRSMPMPSAAVESRAGHAPAQRHNRHRRTWPCSSTATARQTAPPLCLSARRRAIGKDHGPDACRIGRSPLQCGASCGSSRQGYRAANTTVHARTPVIVIDGRECRLGSALARNVKILGAEVTARFFVGLGKVWLHGCAPTNELPLSMTVLLPRRDRP